MSIHFFQLSSSENDHTIKTDLTRRPIIEAVVNYWKTVDIKTFLKNNYLSSFGRFLLFKDFYHDFSSVFYFNRETVLEIVANGKDLKTIPMRFMEQQLYDLLRFPSILDSFLKEYTTEWGINMGNDEMLYGYHLDMTQIKKYALRGRESMFIHFGDFVIKNMDLDFHSDKNDIDPLKIEDEDRFLEENGMKIEEMMISFFIEGLSKELSQCFDDFESNTAKYFEGTYLL